jgi:ATP-dependent DNA helicase 2 subunit 2
VTLVDDREDEPLLLGPAPVLPKQIAPDWNGSSKHQDREGESAEDEVPAGPSPKYAAASPVPKQESPRKGAKATSTALPTEGDDTLVKDEEEEKPLLIRTANPLEDFRAATASGSDVVTEAAAQLADVIKELVVGPQFPNRRKAELIECMKVLRETCIKVSHDRIKAFRLS